MKVALKVVTTGDDLVSKLVAVKVAEKAAQMVENLDVMKVVVMVPM